MRRTILLLAPLVLAALAACSRSASEPSGESTTSTSTSTPTSTPTPTLALTWTDPPRWQRRPPSTSMRAAEYRLPGAAAGDGQDAECIVITFGPGQGGGVDENIDRWVGQFASPSAGPTRTTRTVNGMSVTRVEVAGSYTPMQMPGAPAQGSKGASRLLGAIVQAPSGLWFFKLTGPDATVKAAAADFDAMIDSARPR